MIQFKKEGNNKQKNIDIVCQMTRTAVKEGHAKIVMLPECFNSEYNEKQFLQNAELIPGGPTCTAMSNLAKECGIYLLAGTWPERDPNNSKTVYNTISVYGPDGTMLAKHRKVHLYDVNIPGCITFTESNAFTAGKDLNMFEACGLKFGLAVCHDSFFPEFAMLYRQRGCDVLYYPCAYHTSVCPRLWDVVFRGRANDNQVYVAAVSEAQDPTSCYTSYAHTQMVDPWGTVVAQGGADTEIVYVNIGKYLLKLS